MKVLVRIRYSQALRFVPSLELVERARTPWRRSPGPGPRRRPGCASCAGRRRTAGRGTAARPARTARCARRGSQQLAGSLPSMLSRRSPCPPRPASPARRAGRDRCGAVPALGRTCPRQPPPYDDDSPPRQPAATCRAHCSGHLDHLRERASPAGRLRHPERVVATLDGARPGGPARPGCRPGRRRRRGCPAPRASADPRPTGRSSSARRDFSGRPGGCSGKARASTPCAPTLARGAAGDPGPGRPAADEQRARRRHSSARGRRARPVERRRRRGHLAPGDPPGLLDPDDRRCRAPAARGQRDQVGGLDPAAGAVPEDQRGRAGRPPC